MLAVMTDSCPSTLIIGAGTFGLSTAYHLALRGYNDITVVDRYPPPSRGSAMYDLNKMWAFELSSHLFLSLITIAASVANTTTTSSVNAPSTRSKNGERTQSSHPFITKQAGIFSLRRVSISVKVEAKLRSTYVIASMHQYVEVVIPSGSRIQRSSAVIRRTSPIARTTFMVYTTPKLDGSSRRMRSRR